MKPRTFDPMQPNLHLTMIGTSASSDSARRFNEALQHPWVASVCDHLQRREIAFSPASLAEAIAGIPEFPALTIGAFLSAMKSSGILVKGVSVEDRERSSIGLPLLCFLGGSGPGGVHMMLAEVLRLGRSKAYLNSGPFGQTEMSLEEFNRRWSGLLLLIEGVDSPSVKRAHLETRRYENDVRIFDDFLSLSDCRALIQYCEDVAFHRSPVQQKRGNTIAPVVDTRVRSSTTAMLRDRNHPILADLYRRCAQLENLPSELIEDIQCVRYRRGQRFRTHFDSSSDHPRIVTFLVYLNEEFQGGETSFPRIGKQIEPRTGRCVRFSGCEADGRTIWASEHAGLPVTEGVKYALNIWLQCPAGTGGGNR